MKKMFSVVGAMALTGASMYGGYWLGSNKKKLKKKLPSSLGKDSTSN